MKTSVKISAAVCAQWAAWGTMYDSYLGPFVGLCVYGFVYATLTALESLRARPSENPFPVPPDNKRGAE
jgi:hypothetical protein